jgi:hypothetical protein
MYGKPFFEGMKEILNQAQRQRVAAKGVPIHWHFAEREVADLARKLFENEGFKNVKVFHTPVQQ